MGIYFATYFSYALLIVIGHIRDFFGRWLLPSEYSHLLPNEVCPFVRPFDFWLLINSVRSGIRAALLRFRLVLHPTTQAANR